MIVPLQSYSDPEVVNFIIFSDNIQMFHLDGRQLTLRNNFPNKWLLHELYAGDHDA